MEACAPQKTPLAHGHAADQRQGPRLSGGPGYGVGLSVRLPDRKPRSKVRVIELQGFPVVKLGLLHRGESTGNSKVRSAFLEEVKKQAAQFQPHNPF